MIKTYAITEASKFCTEIGPADVIGAIVAVSWAKLLDASRRPKQLTKPVPSSRWEQSLL
jgi:hypothetical protein